MVLSNPFDGVSVLDDNGERGVYPFVSGLTRHCSGPLCPSCSTHTECRSTRIETATVDRETRVHVGVSTGPERPLFDLDTGTLDEGRFLFLPDESPSSPVRRRDSRPGTGRLRLRRLPPPFSGSVPPWSRSVTRTLSTRFS